MPNFPGLLEVLKESRQFLARPENDFTWSSWSDQDAALMEMDGHIQQVERGLLPGIKLEVLYVVAGPIQEVSLSSGWSREFLVLAERFDHELARAQLLIQTAAALRPG